MEKKVRTKKTNVNFKVIKETGLSYETVNNFFEEEGKMAANDKLQTETKDRKNDVEGYFLFYLIITIYFVVYNLSINYN